MNDLNRVENLIFYEDDNLLMRKDGILLEYLYDFKKNGIDFKVFMNNENNKLVYYNHRFRKLSNNSRDNINTDLGKQLRLNRSIQVEVNNL